MVKCVHEGLTLYILQADVNKWYVAALNKYRREAEMRTERDKGAIIEERHRKGIVVVVLLRDEFRGISLQLPADMPQTLKGSRRIGKQYIAYPPTIIRIHISIF